MIYLSNPGNILINNCVFLSNIAKIGTCIYYEEFYKYHSFQLYNNVFIKNIAIYGGAGLYLENNFYNLMPNKANIFNKNQGIYGNDFTTSPFRIKIINPKKIRNLTILPGITEISFVFQILDYYNQYAYVKTTSSIKLLKQKNKIFSEILGKSNEIIIDTQTNIVVINGEFFIICLNFIKI